MKKNFTLYDRATGMFTGSHYFGNPSLHETQDLASLDGHHDHLSSKVDVSNGNVVDYQPPQPDTNHEWDGKTRRWLLNAATTARIAAVQAAQARIAELATPERHLVRRLTLNPSDADARQALVAMDEELARLSKLSDPSVSSESVS